jgi:hypothetical protein
MSKIGIFLSYAHTDGAVMERLAKHLRVLAGLQGLEVWIDWQISPGADWREEILRAIDAAQIAVLLISIDFLNSTFIQEEEVPRILEHHRTGALRAVPVIARPCSWRRVSWLSELQVRPRDGRPLPSRGQRLDAELAAIAEEILDLAGPFEGRERATA